MHTDSTLAPGRISAKDVMPKSPENLYRLHRLCLRIYGLMARDLPEQAQTAAQAGGGDLRKKDRKALGRLLEDELPVFIALFAMEKLAAEPRFDGEGAAEMVRSLLLPCFSLSYSRLYNDPADPLKHVLSKVDWYLDGDKGGILPALINYLNANLDNKLGEALSLAAHIREIFMPEMTNRLNLAFRYEFS